MFNILHKFCSNTALLIDILGEIFLYQLMPVISLGRIKSMGFEPELPLMGWPGIHM